MLDRRHFVTWSAAALAAGALPVRADHINDLNGSPLIYLTPIRSDGAESRCHSEIWYVAMGKNMYVVTATDAWRAQAVLVGLERARVWVGDKGRWKSGSRAFRDLPMLDTRADQVLSSDEQQRVLNQYGEKYASSWGQWGPRFRNSLADGSRVMLRYTPV